MNISPLASKTMTKILYKQLAVAFLAVFILISSICVHIADAQETALEPVTIQLKWHHQYQFAGYYAAVEKGFYAEEGLEVELRQFDSPEYVDNVLQGRAQYGVSDPGLILRRLNGQPTLPVNRAAVVAARTS